MYPIFIIFQSLRLHSFWLTPNLKHNAYWLSRTIVSNTYTYTWLSMLNLHIIHSLANEIAQFPEQTKMVFKIRRKSRFCIVRNVNDRNMFGIINLCTIHSDFIAASTLLLRRMVAAICIKCVHPRCGRATRYKLI